MLAVPPEGPGEFAPQPAGCTYEVDASLRLVSVDAAWNTCALADDAPELLAPAIIGRPLMSCLADATSKHLFDRLFAVVRTEARSVTLPIRCDSPAERRWLVLTIAPGAAGFHLESRVARREPRPAVSWLARDRRRRDDWLRMCSWCNLVAVDGTWVSVEDAATGLNMLEQDVLPSITHGICPSCAREVLAALPGHTGEAS